MCYVLALLLPLPGEILVRYNSGGPTRRLPLRLTPGRQTVVVLTDSGFTKTKLSKNSFFAKVSGSELIDVPYGQIDYSSLFENLDVNIIQISISGAAAQFGWTIQKHRGTLERFIKDYFVVTGPLEVRI